MCIENLVVGRKRHQNQRRKKERKKDVEDCIHGFKKTQHWDQNLILALWHTNLVSVEILGRASQWQCLQECRGTPVCNFVLELPEIGQKYLLENKTILSVNNLVYDKNLLVKIICRH